MVPTPSVGNEPEFDGPAALPSCSVSESYVYDADGYSRAVAGARVVPVQVGPGVGPSRVETVKLDELVATTCSIGFPMRTHGSSLEDRVTIVQFNSLPADRTRWCEISIDPGALLVYGPGVLHTAINSPGLSFTFVTVPIDALRAAATQLRTELEMPKAGEVRSIPRSPGTRDVSAALADLRQIGAQPEPWSYPVVEDVNAAIVRMLSPDDDQSSRHRVGTRIDSRVVVADCIHYAEALDRVPSVAELCLVTHVSERRLRQAFTDEFGMPPTRYFRLWALQHANLRLRQSPSRHETVTNVASRLGFLHLGRFSAHYQQVYRELPSVTLRREDPSTSEAVDAWCCARAR